MKSFLLLPRSPEAERMREELTGQLIEYSLCKKIAGKRGRMAGTAFVSVRKPMEVEQDATYTLQHDPALLEQAWNSLMGRSLRRRVPAQEQFEPLVAAPFVSVASRVVHVLRGLVTGKVKRDSRGQTVATFLAVLELVRAGRITIDEDGALAVRRTRTSRREG